MKREQLELRELAQYVNELCLQARQEERIEPIYHATQTLAAVISPAGRFSLDPYRWFQNKLHASLKEVGGPIAELVCPRRHPGKTHTQWWPHYYVGFYLKSYFQEYLQKDVLARNENVLQAIEFPYDESMIYVRKSIRPREAWLVLADPFEFQQRTLADKA